MQAPNLQALKERDVIRYLEASHQVPGAIKRACQAVDALLARNRDNLRDFFDQCFPVLLKRVFGYDDFEASWLNMVVRPGREDDARALVALLSPDGALFAAIRGADAEQLIQFIFPVERLPAHTQELLQSGPGRAELDSWPQYRAAIKRDTATGRVQVHLGVLAYFMFWNAFYVLRGNGQGAAGRNGVGGVGVADLAGGGGLRRGPVGQAVGTTLARDAHGLQENLRARLDGLLHAGGGSGGYGVGAGGGSLAGSSGSDVVGRLLRSDHPYYALLRRYLESFLPAGGNGNGGMGTPGAPSSSSAAAHGGGGGGGGFRSSIDPLSPLFGGGSAAATMSAAGGGLTQRRGGYLSLTPVGGGGGSLVLSPPSYYTGGGGGGGSRPAPSPGELLLNVLLEFWLTDVSEPVVAEPSTATLGPGVGQAAAGPAGSRDNTPGPATGPGTPQSAAARGASGGGSSTPPGAAGVVSGALRSFAYQPPTAETVQALRVMFRHIHVIEDIGSPRPAQASPSPAWLPEPVIKTKPAPSGRLAAPVITYLLSGPCGAPAVQHTSRKLYRTLRRAFAHWPVASSAPLTPLLELWADMMVPWRTAHLHIPPRAAGTPSGGAATADFLRGAAHGLPGAALVGRVSSDLAHRLHLPGGGGVTGSPAAAPGVSSNGSSGMGQYSRAWRPHVLSHLPFYTLLLPHFLELTAARLAYRPQAAVADMAAVLGLLAQQQPLLAELARVEQEMNRFMSTGGRRPDASGGSGSGEYAELLPWLADQAADWEAAAGANGGGGDDAVQSDPMYRLFTVSRTSAGFVAYAVLAMAKPRPMDRQLLAAAEAAAGRVLPLDQSAALFRLQAPAPSDGDGGRFPPAGRWQAVRYKGDWMRRPIASNEIGPLVRLLVRLSDVINRRLGLDLGPPGPEEEEEPSETVLQDWLRSVRRRQLRVNLRPLAELQTLAWGLAAALALHWLLTALAHALCGSGDMATAAAVETAAARQYSQHGHHQQQQQQQQQQQHHHHHYDH